MVIIVYSNFVNYFTLVRTIKGLITQQNKGFQINISGEALYLTKKKFSLKKLLDH